jgi:hypothetical protein
MSFHSPPPHHHPHPPLSSLKRRHSSHFQSPSYITGLVRHIAEYLLRTDLSMEDVERFRGGAGVTRKLPEGSRWGLEGSGRFRGTLNTSATLACVRSCRKNRYSCPPLSFASIQVKKQSNKKKAVRTRNAKWRKYEGRGGGRWGWRRKQQLHVGNS